MAGLFKITESNSCRAVAIVGMTKNVGKTVTLNYLIREFKKEGRTLGLVSAGYDGERFDRLTLKDKPRIYAPQGSYVATAEACFKAAEAGLQLIEVSNLSTSLGPVCIACVQEGGLVEMAGPGSVNGLKELILKMSQLGAESILVDGAINRIASASPAVTGATVLATGAALGPTMEDVVRKTVFRRNLLVTPSVDDQLLFGAARDALVKGSAAALNFENDRYLAESVSAAIPLLAAKQVVGQCRSETAALVFGGALVDGTLFDIMELKPSMPAVIVENATKLFITSEAYNRYINRGGKLLVLDKLNLLAVTLNPTDPGGRGYDPQMFLERMAEALSPCPVFDLVHEGSYFFNRED